MSRKEHPAWEEELMPYVDGQLDAVQASSIAEHLKGCQDCASAVADARRLSQQMQAWEVEEVSEKMDERVLAELQLQRGNGNTRARKASTWWTKGRVWTYGLTGAFASAALLLFVITPSLLRSREPAPSASLSWSNATEESGLTYEVRKEQPQEGVSEPTSPQSLALAQPQAPSEVPGPMVIRTARLTVVTKEFDNARSRIEGIARQSQGYLDQLTILGEVGSLRTISATLRFPSDRIDSGLAELRKLGNVREESQGSSDVTSQYVDLQARLTNARNTEQRLLALQRERTDKLVDVVSVEREISRVRGEIERMVAQQKDISNKVQFATVQLHLSEEYRAEIQPAVPTAGTQLRNASIDGYHAALQSLLGVALFLLRIGPALLLWCAVFLPIVLLVRRRLHAVRPS